MQSFFSKSPKVLFLLFFVAVPYTLWYSSQIKKNLSTFSSLYFLAEMLLCFSVIVVTVTARMRSNAHTTLIYLSVFYTRASMHKTRWGRKKTGEPGGNPCRHRSDRACWFRKIIKDRVTSFPGSFIFLSYCTSLPTILYVCIIFIYLSKNGMSCTVIHIAKALYREDYPMSGNWNVKLNLKHRHWRLNKNLNKYTHF